jgi:hypothetical protein
LVRFESFPPDLQFVSPWQNFVRGQAALELTDSSLRFINHTTASSYTNAQLDDYQTFARQNFLWRPPLQMIVRARFSHPAGELRGTAGFGFWNDPFMMTGWRWPALPRVIWFFYSSHPSNMKLDINTPGCGWKAGTLDAWCWRFFSLLPVAPIAIPLMNVKALYRLCWPIGQRAINVSETLLPVTMTDWHSYKLVWHEKTAHFYVDDQLILDCNTPPRGPLGFVIWLDNQYMVVTPCGKFASGLVELPNEQWMEVSRLIVEDKMW